MVNSSSIFKFSIRKNDLVQVISGRDKDKVGKVLKVDSKTGKVTIDKVNMVKRHVKPSQQYPQGGIIEKEIPIHHAKILLMCGKCNRGVRHGIKQSAVGPSKTKKKGAEVASTEQKMTKIRVCKRCGETIESAA